MYLRSNKRKCLSALLILLVLGVVVLIDMAGFWIFLGFGEHRVAYALDFLVLGLIALAMLVFCEQSPQAKVDRLLAMVLKEAGARDAKSVTFVLNDSDRSLYVDIDEWVVVAPCKYKLTPQLGNLIMARHNVTPYRMDDGLSYAYFLTPNSAK